MLTIVHGVSIAMTIINTTAKSSLMLPLGNHLLTLGGQFEKEELSDHTSNQISDRNEIESSQWQYTLLAS